MRAIIAVPVMTFIFIGWVLYRMLITRDIKKYKTEVFGGFFFIGAWVILYEVFLHL